MILPLWSPENQTVSPPPSVRVRVPCKDKRNRKWIHPPPWPSLGRMFLCVVQVGGIFIDVRRLLPAAPGPHGIIGIDGDIYLSN